MTAAGQTATRVNVFRLSLSVRAIKVAGLVSFIVLWQIAGSAAPAFYSSPSRVIVELRELLFEDDLVYLTLESGLTMLIGLTLSVIVGVALGLALGVFRRFSIAFEPFLAAFYAVPTAPWIPLMVVWFGIDRPFAIATVVIGTAVLLAFSTAAGIRETDRQYREVSRSFGIRGWTMFTRILLPGSIPFIGAGMRLAIKRSFTAVLIAEYLVGLPGLGLVIRGARESMATDRVFASAVATLIVGVALIAASSAVERRLSRWRPATF
jgi:ABC-type nitrate/sulfonate/bicarbonate transport system permease component